MPRILIVDDAEVDRAFVQSLLDGQEDIDDLAVEAAVGGKPALRSIEADPPDVVVTDLVMPDLGGLELVETIGERFPLVPVIVMTSRGSEESAVEALQRGAASYVPKNMLASLLVGTIESVLSATSRRRGRARLLQVIVKNHSEFVLGNDRKLFRPLLQYLQDTMTEFGLHDETESMRVCVAIEEALNNAAEHGNLELDSELRERDFREYLALMKRRCDEEAYRSRRIHFEALFTPTKSVFDIRDEGAGFDRSALPDPTDASRLAAVSGRGLTLMRAFMDEVEFNDKGNRVRLVKRTASAAVG